MSIGDINGTERGTGARYNTGKPDYSLIPLTLVADSYAVSSKAVNALRELGHFQATRNPAYLITTLMELGLAGWVECAQVFEYGKAKYAAWNWCRGMPWSVPLACAARHLMAIIDGEEIDPESKRPHRGHVFCNVVMLLQYVKTYPEGDDLPPAGLLTSGASAVHPAQVPSTC